MTLVKAARVGFTTLLTGALGSYIINEPSPVLALLPTEDDCRRYMVMDVEPIFEVTPALKGMLASSNEVGERNTLLSRRFPGGTLKIVAAKAPRNLRAHTARVLMIDEADAMEVGAEGDPILLGERRTQTFKNRKIIIGSTPVHLDTSHVLRAYGNSDQRVFEVHCPSCGAFTEIEWANIRGGVSFDPCKHRRRDPGLGRTGAGVSTQAARDYLRKGVFEAVAPGWYAGAGPVLHCVGRAMRFWRGGIVVDA